MPIRKNWGISEEEEEEEGCEEVIRRVCVCVCVCVRRERKRKRERVQCDPWPHPLFSFFLTWLLLAPDQHAVWFSLKVVIS